MDNYYRRPLPEGLIAFASPEGRALFREALAAGGMEGWFPLAETFHTQSEPPFCALGSLVVVLNALAMDPGRTWKGPWRWYSEELLDCCDSLATVREKGMSLPRFACLARCNGLAAAVRYGDEASVQQLEADIVAAASGGPHVIVSFGRSALGQTGDGHYSPIGGWHAGRRLALVMDVARFKYPPFWVPVEQLHAASATLDPATGRARGWIVLDRDGSVDARVWRFQCETPGWRDALDALQTAIPATLAAARPQTARALVEALTTLPAAALALVTPRDGDHADVHAALRACPLYDPVATHPDADRLVLLALVAPDEALAEVQPSVREELTRLREGLAPLARAEVERLRAQLSALRDILPG